MVLIALLAGAVRLYELELRPVHTDEAVNAFQIGEILSGKVFRYTSVDYHGPLYFAVAALCAKSAGAKSLASLDEWLLRVPAVICSLLMLALVYPLARHVGSTAALLAAAVWAIHPIAVYYGRYAIHESLFVFFTFAFLLALPRALQTGNWIWQTVTGVLVGLMFATKETAVLSVFAAFIALLAQKPWRAGLNMGALIIGGCACVAVAVPCFTWGFQNPEAIVDVVAAGRNYLSRAAGQGHEKPWFYYGELLLVDLRSGPALVLLAAAGSWFWRATPFGRFLSIYTLVLFIGYSLIPYKTPWLLLNAVIPLGVLAGMGMASLWQRSLWLGSLALFIALGACALDVQKLCFRFASDESNPLAYAHTLPDLVGLPRLVHQWREQNGRDPSIAVVTEDPWPLPWYLRQQAKVGYWRAPQQATPSTDILILDPQIAENMALDGWRPSIFGQRPGALLLLYRRTTPTPP